MHSDFKAIQKLKSLPVGIESIRDLLDKYEGYGNTIKSIEKAIKDMGGNVLGVGAVLNILELNNNKEVFSIIDVHEG